MEITVPNGVMQRVAKIQVGTIREITLHTLDPTIRHAIEIDVRVVPCVLRGDTQALKSRIGCSDVEGESARNVRIIKIKRVADADCRSRNAGHLDGLPGISADASIAPIAQAACSN